MPSTGWPSSKLSMPVRHISSTGIKIIKRKILKTGPLAPRSHTLAVRNLLSLIQDSVKKQHNTQITHRLNFIRSYSGFVTYTKGHCCRWVNSLLRHNTWALSRSKLKEKRRKKKKYIYFQCLEFPENQSVTWMFPGLARLSFWPEKHKD
jgi:hypothetical protein